MKSLRDSSMLERVNNIDKVSQRSLEPVTCPLNILHNNAQHTSNSIRWAAAEAHVNKYVILSKNPVLKCVELIFIS